MDREKDPLEVIIGDKEETIEIIGKEEITEITEIIEIIEIIEIKTEIEEIKAGGIKEKIRDTIEVKKEIEMIEIIEINTKGMIKMIEWTEVGMIEMIEEIRFRSRRDMKITSNLESREETDLSHKNSKKPF